MEVTDRKCPAPPTDATVQPPWVVEPPPKEAPRQEAAAGHEDAPIEEPGYGHGV